MHGVGERRPPDPLSDQISETIHITISTHFYLLPSRFQHCEVKAEMQC